MANTIKVLFWLHRSRQNNKGFVPLKLRITYQTKKADRSTGYWILPEQWNVKKQRVKSSNEQHVEINSWINECTSKIAEVFRGIDSENNLHLPSVMESLFMVATDEPTLLTLVLEYTDQLKERVNKDFAYSTYEKYVFTYNKVKAFIEKSLRKKDILLRDLTPKFIMDFDHYLRVEENNQHNTAVKYCINLKRVINVAVIQGKMKVSPFNIHKTTYIDTPQVYLSEAEVNALEKVELDKPNYKLVRDLFLFQCCTGLAYTDMMNLQEKDISIDFAERKWIVKPRQKTGVISTIPLLPKALEIIENYKTSNLDDKTLFPGYSIQKYNQYIAAIGELAGINKRLSSHVGRRTFGNIALSKGISINVISKVLGHSNTLITQRIYAITTQAIIQKEIEKW